MNSTKHLIHRDNFFSVRVYACALFAGLAIYCFVAMTNAQTAAPNPPSGPATTIPSTQTIEMPFDFSQGVVMLQVDFGGSRPARLVLDTGNPTTALDTEAAQEIGLPLSDADKQTVGSGANATVYYRIKPPKFLLGATEFSAGHLAVAPVRKSLQAIGLNCDGLLGYGALKDRVVQIDYPSRRLRFLNAADAKAALARGQSFAISWKKYWSKSPDLVTVDDVQVDGHRLCAQVDTALRFSAVLFSTKLTWLRSEPATGVATVRYEEADLPPARITGGLALGDRRLGSDVTVYIAGADAHVPETDLSVILGTAFFQNTVLTLDFPGSRLMVGASPR